MPEDYESAARLQYRHKDLHLHQSRCQCGCRCRLRSWCWCWCWCWCRENPEKNLRSWRLCQVELDHRSSVSGAGTCGDPNFRAERASTTRWDRIGSSRRTSSPRGNSGILGSRFGSDAWRSEIGCLNLELARCRFGFRRALRNHHRAESGFVSPISDDDVWRPARIRGGNGGCPGEGPPAATCDLGQNGPGIAGASGETSCGGAIDRGNSN
jgi:hypothetical protein